MAVQCQHLATKSPHHSHLHRYSLRIYLDWPLLSCLFSFKNCLAWAWAPFLIQKTLKKMSYAASSPKLFSKLQALSLPVINSSFISRNFTHLSVYLIDQDQYWRCEREYYYFDCAYLFPQHCLSWKVNVSARRQHLSIFWKNLFSFVRAMMQLLTTYSNFV